VDDRNNNAIQVTVKHFLVMKRDDVDIDAQSYYFSNASTEAYFSHLLMALHILFLYETVQTATRKHQHRLRTSLLPATQRMIWRTPLWQDTTLEIEMKYSQT